MTGQRDVFYLSLPSCPNPVGLVLTLTLRAEYKYSLAGNDLEFVVLAASGHLDGSQRDHTFGEGVLKENPVTLGDSNWVACTQLS